MAEKQPTAKKTNARRDAMIARMREEESAAASEEDAKTQAKKPKGKRATLATTVDGTTDKG